MWIRTILSVLLALGGWAVLAPPVHAACVVETTGTYTEGTSIRDFKCDTSGNLKTSGSGGGGGGGAATATATEAAPTYTEGSTTSPLSLDLAGNLRTTLGTLLSGEDQTNNLLMTSGAAVRVTQILGTGGAPSTATDATSGTSQLPVGLKTFLGTVACTGTCVQTQKIYGTYANSATVAASALVCTLTLSATTQATDWCATDRNFAYWFVVTTLTGGTTPLSGVFVQY